MALSGRQSSAMLVAGVEWGEPSLLVSLWDPNTAGGAIGEGRIRDGRAEGISVGDRRTLWCRLSR